MLVKRGDACSSQLKVLCPTVVLRALDADDFASSFLGRKKSSQTQTIAATVMALGDLVAQLFVVTDLHYTAGILGTQMCS